jgi:iron(III) transport system ATP-binding protein
MSDQVPCPPVLQFRHVARRYGAVTAIDDLSFAVGHGELVVLLGPAGSGKTMTLRLIAGPESPTLGEILIGGREMSGVAGSARKVGGVFEPYALSPRMTLIENVSSGRGTGTAKAAALERARDKLRLVGLAGLEEQFPHELSGEQQRRLALAQALFMEPEILLLDAPLANIDANLRRRVRDDIRELQRALGLAVIYATRDPEEALAVADRIILLSKGRLVQEGTPRELYERPASRFAARFMGEVNVLPATLRRLDGERAKVTVGGIQIVLPHRGAVEGTVELAVRPEAFRIEPGALADTVAGEVARSAYLGSRVEYTVASAFGELLVVDYEPRRPFPAGTAVGLRFAPHGVTVLPR